MQQRRLILNMVAIYTAFAAIILVPVRPIEAAASVGVLRSAQAKDGNSQPDTPSGTKSSSKSKTPPKDLPEGKGKDLAQKQCGTCHATNVWSNQHHTREQWSSIIDNMVSKGMHASDDDLDTINDYLADHFGPVPPAPATPPSGSESAPPAAAH